MEEAFIINWEGGRFNQYIENVEAFAMSSNYKIIKYKY